MSCSEQRGWHIDGSRHLNYLLADLTLELFRTRVHIHMGFEMAALREALNIDCIRPRSITYTFQGPPFRRAHT